MKHLLGNYLNSFDSRKKYIEDLTMKMVKSCISFFNITMDI